MRKKNVKPVGEHVRFVGQTLRMQVDPVHLVNSENFKQALARARAKDLRNNGTSDDDEDKS